MAHGGERNLIGFDVNACRIRAVNNTGESPQPLSFDEGKCELPMAVSLEGRRPQAGWPGVRLCRTAPHLACLNFLPSLGESRQWSAGRHRLDAVQAAWLVLERLTSSFKQAEGTVLAAPAYLSDTQLSILTALFEKSRLHVLGTVASPLAVALATYAEHPWAGPAFVLDADQHGLTVAVVSVEGHQARLLDAQVLPDLSLRAWKERLLNAIADHCIRQSRRDLRDSASAEQSVYEQLDDLLDVSQRGQMMELLVQAGSWYQNLILQPEDLASFCAPLVRQAVIALRSLRVALDSVQPSNMVLLSASAGRLPGLAGALEAEVEEAMGNCGEEEEDFGEGLLEEGCGWAAGIHVLGHDAAAQAALNLAARIRRGDLPGGHLDVAPLPAQQPLDAGPARLHFRGQDHLLGSLCFSLGRQMDCELVFDSEEYPSVSARHCEIVYDRRTYFLRDWSRNGTLVNDRPVEQQVTLRPGDWIRLGPGGPLLRFLGRGADQLKLMTTA